MQETSIEPASAPAAQVSGGGEQAWPWPEASATGIGSMPGTDPAQACQVVLDEVPDFPFLPELPARGAGADIIGRTAALLVDLPVETTPRGWKLADRPGRDQRRADSFLSFDLDALQQAADGYDGALKVSACGPLTLAARVEMPRSQNPALADPGALADLTASLAEGIAAHVAEVRARVPGATIVVQLDEPALPAVLTGRVPTASGLGTVRALEEMTATSTLRSVLEVAATAAGGGPTVVHCCAPRVPFLLLREAGAGAVSFDLALLRQDETDTVAEIAEAGLGLLVGAVPAIQDPTAQPVAPKATATAVIEFWRRMTLASRLLPQQVVITPACGLAGSSPAQARAVLKHCREAARIAPELAEESE